MISLFDQMRKKRLLRNYVIFLSALIVFHSVLYYPLSLYMYSNTILKNSIIYLLLTEIAEPLAVYLYFWGSFAYLIYVGVRYSIKSAIPFFAAYSIGALLRYAIQNVCFILMMGFSLWESSLDLFALIFTIVMDLVIGSLALLILWLAFRKRTGSKKKEDSLEAYMPFSGFFSFSNPMQKTAFLLAILPSVARLLSRGYYDIRLVIAGNVPDSAPEILLMITYYLTDCLTAVIGSLIIVMMLSSFRLSEMRARMKYEDA